MIDFSKVEAPAGVQLREFENTGQLRQDIYKGIEESFSNVFPQEYGGVRLELEKVDWEGPEIIPLSKQKDALAQQAFLSRKLKGTLALYDTNTGGLLDRQKKTLMRAPMLTQRGTFIHNGNEYTISNQARLLPGAYVRRKNNGEIEAQVNVRQGTGPSFSAFMDQDSGVLYTQIRNSKLKLYPLLREMGVDEEELERRWGKGLLEVNRAAAKDGSKVVARAYERLLKKMPEDASPEEKANALRGVFDGMMLHEDTVRETLPNILHRRATSMGKKKVRELPSGFKDYGANEQDISFGVEGLLDTLDNVIATSRGLRDTDFRDNIIFKRFHTPDKLIRERVLLDSGKLRLGLLRRVARQKTLDVVPTNYFDPYIHNLIVKSQLSAPLEEINPLHLTEQLRRFTGMGEGGIPSDDAITAEAQSVMPAQFGFVDLLAGPESSRAGVDGRFAHGTRIGNDGKVYQIVRDRKSGKLRWMSPTDLYHKRVRIPD